MARTTCIIQFDNNPEKVFYGGQLLSGSVMLKLHKEKTVRGISIKIDGRAYCRWTQGSGDSKRTYVGEEIYLAERQYFLGDKTGEIELQPGVYNYTFQCRLPVGLPTSVEATHGHIRYSATVNLDRPMWPDQEFEEGFTVLKPLNLNDMPHLQHPLVTERRKTFSMCCLLCCCRSQPLLIMVRQPVSGYTPGDKINLHIQLRNQSDEDVESIRVCVVKNITFRPSSNSSKTKVDTVEVCESLVEHGCRAYSEENVTVNCTVPSIPPTDTTSCSICQVEYVLKVNCAVSCCHSDPEIQIPITIGTVPFTQRSIGFTEIDTETTPLAPYPTDIPSLPYPIVTMQPQPMPMPQTMPMPQPVPFDAAATQPSAPPFDPLTMYTDCDPPTYEQAVSGQVDIQGKMFAPFYPVFRRSDPPNLTVSEASAAAGDNKA